MPKYIKQLTRENTLLERSLRTLAYHTSIKEIGKASISKSPILGIGKITSLYYDPIDYKKQQNIIFKEFKGVRIETMGAAMRKYLEEGYLWARESKNKKMNRKDLLAFIDAFFINHSHSRGALVYGYWGEPIITARFKELLRKNKSIKKSDIDQIVSVLSTPQAVVKPLSELHSISRREIIKRQKLLKKIRLNPEEKELAEILSWFTFFYEFGERVSYFLYEQLLEKIRKIVRNEKEMSELEWYDPESLVNFIKGEKLSKEELARRKEMYILNINKDKVEVLSGGKARKFYDKNFKEDLKINNCKEIRGVVASVGKARGRVKIIITQEDQTKMKKGDILVSTMTTPYLMSAVNKAAAIITDEGGLTAHAAIIAREMDIPCIIGTKIATQILKDGDLVEVDALKGIIRKL